MVDLVRLDQARRGFSIAQITPASTAAVTCSEVALLCGTSAPRLLDRQPRAVPVGALGMAHQQHAELVHAAR